MTSMMFEQMYLFNAKYWENFDSDSARKDVKPKKGEWGGPIHRLLVHAVSSLSFLLLLRLQEVLAIKVEDITLRDNKIIVVNVPYRKSQQLGGEFRCHILPMCYL
jgi:hypothetical protein